MLSSATVSHQPTLQQQNNVKNNLFGVLLWDLWIKICIYTNICIISSNIILTDTSSKHKWMNSVTGCRVNSWKDPWERQHCKNTHDQDSPARRHHGCHFNYYDRVPQGCKAASQQEPPHPEEKFRPWRYWFGDPGTLKPICHYRLQSLLLQVFLCV